MKLKYKCGEEQTLTQEDVERASETAQWNIVGFIVKHNTEKHDLTLPADLNKLVCSKPEWIQ